MSPSSRIPRSRRMAAPRRSSAGPVIGGVAGAVVLAVIIAVAAGGRKPPPQAPPRPASAAPAGDARRVEDTGVIMFVCSNSSRHPDKEQILSTCTACGKRSTFYWEDAHGTYRCFGCSGLFDKGAIKCPDCGKVPTRPRIKRQ